MNSFQSLCRRGLLAAALCLGGALTATAAQAQTNTAWVAQDTVMLAGPSEDYPVVRELDADSRLVVYGCLREYVWCDAAQGSSRGWVYADDIEMVYRNRRIVVGTDVGLFALPWLTFSFDSYWNNHYRTTLWYSDRNHWSGLSWNRPHYGWNHRRDNNWNRRNWGWRNDRDGRDWGRHDGRGDWDRDRRDRDGRGDWNRNDHRQGPRSDHGRAGRRDDSRGDNSRANGWNGEQGRGNDRNNDRRRPGLGMEGQQPRPMAPNPGNGRGFAGPGEGGRREVNRSAPVAPAVQPARAPEQPRLAPQQDDRSGRSEMGGRGRPEREGRSGKADEGERSDRRDGDRHQR